MQTCVNCKHCFYCKEYVKYDPFSPCNLYNMELEGFEENTALITPNPYLGIDSSTYLVDKNWYNSVELN